MVRTRHQEVTGDCEEEVAPSKPSSPRYDTDTEDDAPLQRVRERRRRDLSPPRRMTRTTSRDLGNRSPWKGEWPRARDRVLRRSDELQSTRKRRHYADDVVADSATLGPRTKRVRKQVERLQYEREERQREVKSIHQEIITLAEQTNLGLDEEASRLWEALQSHNHDIIMDGDNSSQVGNVQIQSLANKAGIKPPRKIQLKQSLNSSMTTSRSKLHQTDGKGAHHHEANISQQQEKSQCQTNGKGLHQQDENQPQQANHHQSPTHKYPTRNLLGFDQQPRVRVLGVYPE